MKHTVLLASNDERIKNAFSFLLQTNFTSKTHFFRCVPIGELLPIINDCNIYNIVIIDAENTDSTVASLVLASKIKRKNYNVFVLTSCSTKQLRAYYVNLGADLVLDKNCNSDLLVRFIFDFVEFSANTSTELIAEKFNNYLQCKIADTEDIRQRIYDILIFLRFQPRFCGSEHLLNLIHYIIVNKIDFRGNIGKIIKSVARITNREPLTMERTIRYVLEQVFLAYEPIGIAAFDNLFNGKYRPKVSEFISVIVEHLRQLLTQTEPTPTKILAIQR